MKKFFPFFLQAVNLLITAILGFIFLPLITRYLEITDVGIYAQVLSIFSLGILLINSGTTNYNYRFLNNENSKNFSNSYKAFLVFLLLGIAVVLLYFISYTKFEFTEIITILIALLFFGNFKYFHSILYSNQEHKSFVLLNIVEATTRYLLAFIFILWGINYLAYFMANIISAIFVLLLLFTFNKKIIYYFRYKGAEGNSLKYTLKYSSMYTASGLGLWVLTSIDILLIGIYMSDERVGVYSLGYTLGFQVITFILMVVNNVFEPKMLSKIKNEIEDYYYLNLVFIYLSIPLIAYLYINSDFYFQVFLKTEFMESVKITKIILFSSFLWGIFKLTSIKLAKDLKPGLFTKLVFLAAAINILLNIVLIPIIGLIGAAISSLLSYGILAVLGVLLIFDYAKLIKFSWTTILVFIIFYFIFILTSLIISNHLISQFTQIILLCIFYLCGLLYIRSGKFGR